MRDYLRWARAARDRTIEQIRELVECESPSRDGAAVNRCGECLADQVADIADVKRIRGESGLGHHLRLQFKAPDRAKRRPPVLLLGHADTVWPIGTLARMPFRRTRERVFGPGVLDMKSGLAFACQAVRLLNELEIDVGRRVTMLVVSDEEIGSPTSRAVTEKLARESGAVLVVEPGTGLEGKLKTARKGVGRYTVRVKGRAAHAGVDFEKGASAIAELARQLRVIEEMTDLQRGVTLNAGVVEGGTASNVIAENARAEIDVRVVRREDEVRIQKKLVRLRPFDKRCAVEVTGGPNRPPMERSREIGRLFACARKLGAEMETQVDESATGGGSDGNFTAALGVPTLDGLGGVGEGAHGSNESVLISRVADRVALLAGLIARL